jgi:hypothetical protein
MPNLDETGPREKGRMSGRGFGSRACGLRRLGRGYGRESCLRQTKNLALTEEEQKNILKAKLKEIDLEKQEIEKRISEMN